MICDNRGDRGRLPLGPSRGQAALGEAAPSTLPVAAIGSIAFAAISRSGGAARLVSAMRNAAYLEASGEIIWAGGHEAMLHPRALLLAGPPDAWTDAAFALGDVVAWQPLWPRRSDGPAALAAAARALAERTVAAAAPRGFGTLLNGRAPEFPLGQSAPLVAALVAAMHAADLAAARTALHALIGLGPGLTPAGDDVIAGALFAGRLLAVGDLAVGDGRPSAFLEALGGAVREAAVRTNRISAALLGDATRGLGFAALHDLVTALAARDRAGEDRAAQRLATLGHSSGWDMLAGFCLALSANAAPG